MTLKRPPILASWLLNHLGCSANNEAVVGDLHEQYQLRPRRVWYWRQAMGAIAKTFFSEVWRHKLDATYALIVGWATLTIVWLICAPVAGNTAVRTHHACTLFWFIAGTASGCAVGVFARRPKRALLLLYIASIWLYLLSLHPSPPEPYLFTYWADALVLTVSIVLGALPAKSPVRQSSATAASLIAILLTSAVSEGRLSASQDAPLGVIQGTVTIEGGTEPLAAHGAAGLECRCSRRCSKS